MRALPLLLAVHLKQLLSVLAERQGFLGRMLSISKGSCKGASVDLLSAPLRISKLVVWTKVGEDDET